PALPHRHLGLGAQRPPGRAPWAAKGDVAHGRGDGRRPGADIGAAAVADHRRRGRIHLWLLCRPRARQRLGGTACGRAPRAGLGALPVELLPRRQRHRQRGGHGLGGRALAGAGAAARRLRARHRRGGAVAAPAAYLRLPDRNWRRRSLLGWPNTCAGGPLSSARPWCRNITWLDTSRAKPISWVTTTMVRPSSASPRITFSTSPTSSGSSAEVG